MNYIEPELEALYMAVDEEFARLHINAALRRYLPTLRNATRKALPVVPESAHDPSVIYAKMIDKAAERFLRAKRAYELRESGATWSAVGRDAGAPTVGKLLWWKYKRYIELRDLALECSSLVEVARKSSRRSSYLPCIYWTLEGIWKAEGRGSTGWGQTPAEFRDMGRRLDDDLRRECLGL